MEYNRTTRQDFEDTPMHTDSDTTPTTATATCDHCHQPFECEGRLVFGKLRTPPCCPGCTTVIVEERRQREEAERHARLTHEWQKLAPAEYDQIDRSRLPDPGLLDRVLQWQFNPVGLLLHGVTGRGKTRCAIQLLKREHFLGRKVAIVDGWGLSKYPALFSDSTSAARDWLANLLKVDLLLLDDVAKIRLTERAEEALFVLVDSRTSQQRPLILTCNDTGATLASRLSPDRGEPLVRRLREFTTAIHCR